MRERLFFNRTDSSRKADFPQITAPITLGSEIDTLLVMMDYDGFLDDDSISVVYTLADPESGAGIIMRSGKVFCNNFEHEVSYTSMALESSSALRCARWA